MKNKKILLLAIFMIVSVFALSGCMPGGGANHIVNRAGFFTGVWHGWIAPISLIFSFFNKNISIYEVYNNGFLYNLGYYMAIVSGFLGLGLSRKNKK